MNETPETVESTVPNTGTTEAPSLRDSLLATFEEMEGANTEADAPAETTPKIVDGEVSSPDEASSVTEEASGVVEDTGPIEAPVTWSADQKAVFDELAPDSRALFLEHYKNMETGLNQKMQALAEQRKRYEGFDQLLNSYAGQYPNVKRDDLERGIMNTMPQLVATYIKMQQDPVATLRSLADAFNVNDKLSEALLGQDNDEGARSKRQRERELETENQQLKAAQQQAAMARADEQLNQFRNAMDAQGQPKYPYFSELEPTMAKLLQVDSALGLEGAYQRALRLDKHEELLKVEVEKVTKALEEKRRATVKDLRKPGKPTSGRSNGAAQVSTKPKTLREELSDEWDQLANL